MRSPPPPDQFYRGFHSQYGKGKTGNAEFVSYAPAEEVRLWEAEVNGIMKRVVGLVSKYLYGCALGLILV